MFEKLTMTKVSQTVEEATQNNQFLRRLLRIPVFYRVLIANSLIIFIGATGGTWLASQLPSNSYAPTGLIIFITAGWLVSVVMNFVLLRIAFRPLMDLGKVMHRVQEGERSLRAPLTGFDQDADQLASTLNMMLEAINESSRQRAAEIFNAQEEERKRIARELHDETSQVLTSLLISLAVLEESVATEEARDRIGETRMLAHRTLRAIRNLSTDLRPSALDDLGLIPALRWYIKEYQQKFSLDVSFQTSGFKERLPTTLETALYRIVQEALTNIARHAHAHKVNVILKDDPDTIYITITDDGHGFDAEQLQKPPGPGQERGWGLVGMRERASLLDGTLTIESRAGHGTSIHARIPQQPSAPRKNNSAEVSIS
ncbi:MAG TPA: sensor histidine kinase [Ktedonobacteraceae bacterium]|jgi:two-component system sensor histidine kinase UhpB